MKRNHYSEKGQFITFVAVALITLGLLIGIAIDGGRAYLLRSQLYKLVDPMALAGAAALATSGAQTVGEAIDIATAAACDVAQLNGIAPEECGGPGGSENQRVVVEAIPTTGTPTLNCSSPPCVIVSATDTMNTTFMALGTLIGCSTCDAINVAASAVASLEAVSSDIILNLDVTGSMSGGSPPRIQKAKEGAKALVDAVVPSGSTSTTLVGLVPFRGCYDSSGITGVNKCVDSDEAPAGDIVSLTSSNGQLTSGISSLTAKSGSGTNVCEALFMAREELFESGSARSEANKFIILLTDAENHFTDGTRPVSSGCNASDLRPLDQQTYDKATDIKTGQNVGSTGQNVGQTVQIFVIYYGVGANNPNPPPCDPTKVGSVRDDINLAQCIASSLSHYLPAPTPQDIEDQFNKIIDILKSLRLVS